MCIDYIAIKSREWVGERLLASVPEENLLVGSLIGIEQCILGGDIFSQFVAGLKITADPWPFSVQNYH